LLLLEPENEAEEELLLLLEPEIETDEEL